MKITYSHIEPEFQTDIEHETERHAEKLNRLLKRYAADLVYLHGSLEKTPRKTEFNFSVNLNLPTGTLHATGVGSDALGSAKAAFAELEKQVNTRQNFAKTTFGSGSARSARPRHTKPRHPIKHSADAPLGSGAVAVEVLSRKVGQRPPAKLPGTVLNYGPPFGPPRTTPVLCVDCGALWCG